MYRTQPNTGTKLWHSALHELRDTNQLLNLAYLVAFGASEHSSQLYRTDVYNWKNLVDFLTGSGGQLGHLRISQMFLGPIAQRTESP